MEVLNSKLTSNVETYRVMVDTDKWKMELEVQVQDDNTVNEHIETSNTDIWNKLSLEEKYEIDELLAEEFS